MDKFLASLLLPGPPEVELCAYSTSGPVRKQFTCRKIILLDRRTTTGLRTVWTLTLTLPRTLWSSRTLPSATREISSGSHRTANYRSPGRHRGDSLCFRQECPDKKWEFIKLGKILPFHGNVAAELTWLFIFGDMEKKDKKYIFWSVALWWTEDFFFIFLFCVLECFPQTLERLTQ